MDSFGGLEIVARADGERLHGGRDEHVKSLVCVFRKGTGNWE